MSKKKGNYIDIETARILLAPVKTSDNTPLPPGASEDERLKAEVYNKVEDWVQVYLDDKLKSMEQEYQARLGKAYKCVAAAEKKLQKQKLTCSILERDIKVQDDRISRLEKDSKSMVQIWKLVSISAGFSPSGCSLKKLKKRIKQRINDSKHPELDCDFFTKHK